MFRSNDSGEPIHAGILRDLARVSDFSEACSIVLDRVCPEGGYRRAVVVARVHGEVHGVGWGVPEDIVLALVESSADSPVSRLLRETQPQVITDGAAALCPGASALVALPFVLPADGARGLVLLEADRIDERTERVHLAFAECGAVVLRCLELQVLHRRLDRMERQRDLLTGVLNAMPDPALLTDDDNAILLSNRRAEALLSSGPGDSEGRRQAIQINNLLFSSFLTQSVIGYSGATGRELNLVDPRDGSDLYFEALSASLPRDIQGGGVITILRDITDLKRALAELEIQFKRSRITEHRARMERDQLDGVIENVGDPILVTDSRAKIILMNREAERLFESRVEQEDGPTSRTHILANDTKFTGLISTFLLRDATRNVESMELTDPDSGAPLPVEVVSSKIRGAHGEPVAIVSVLHDLRQLVENERLAGELKALNEGLEERIARATQELEERNLRLEWQSRELEKASRLKSEFLANMSHELRTPLNVLIGFTSLLRDGIYGTLDERQAVALDRVRGSAHHLLELINDILDLSKIEAGKMPLAIEEVRLEMVVAEISSAAEQLLAGKPLEFTVEVDPAVPTLRTDRTKIKQILLNLVSNAIKFTESGTIRVVVEPAAGADTIRLVVSDTGIGIHADDLDAIFEDFRQLDQSKTKRHGGTGLGLSITKKLVALLGGKISVWSEPGAGSEFTVEVPVFTDPGVDDVSRRAIIDALARVERTRVGRSG